MCISAEPEPATRRTWSSILCGPVEIDITPDKHARIIWHNLFQEDSLNQNAFLIAIRLPSIIILLK